MDVVFAMFTAEVKQEVKFKRQPSINTCVFTGVSEGEKSCQEKSVENKEMSEHIIQNAYYVPDIHDGIQHFYGLWGGGHFLFVLISHWRP